MGSGEGESSKELIGKKKKGGLNMKRNVKIANRVFCWKGQVYILRYTNAQRKK